MLQKETITKGKEERAMQPTSGGGLSRFRSAPATWLESVLLKEEEEEEEDENESEDPLSFTQLLSTIADAPSQHYGIGDYPSTPTAIHKVRRTRISDRIRKLQQLVPNMDKHFFEGEVFLQG